jgi:hypothetical protein
MAAVQGNPRHAGSVQLTDVDGVGAVRTDAFIGL